MTFSLRRIAIGVSSLALVLASAPRSAHAQLAPPTSPPPIVPATPVVSPSATPGVLASASPIATPSPTSVPSGLPRAIRLDRAKGGIVPGSSLVIAIAGGTGTLAARSTSPSVDAAVDAAGSRLTLFARTPGTATVTVTDAFGDSASIDIFVAPPAGFVPHDVTVTLGGNVSSAYAIARANDEIARQIQAQPKTTLDVHGIVLPSTLHAGDRVDATARVKLDGHGLFVDAIGATTVHVRVDAYPKLDPQVLLYSDDPERLDASADGVLLRATIDATRPARAYVYHVSDTPGRRLYLALLSTSGPASVQVLGYGAGPENAFSFVGHRSTLQYLLERGAQESAVLDVSADAPLLVPLGGRAMRAGDLVAAIYDLRVASGTSVTASVVAVTGDRDPVEVLAGKEIAGDGHGRRGEFSLLGVPPLALAYAIGGAEPQPFAVGAPTIANLRAGGRALGGDYGVLREIALQLTNPTTAPAVAYFYEQPAGGNATTTMWFTGDAAPTEIACVRVPTNRYGIKAWQLAPGETRTVTGEYMTDGTSFFPLLFGVTGAPPSPPPGPYSPDACTPKTPPPSAPPTTPPSPSPAAS